MILDIFIVNRINRSSSSSSISYIELGQYLDRRAPRPWLGVCPRGEPIAAFGVDFRRAPAAVCARLGFDYCHLEFKEFEEELYTPERELGFGSLPFDWMRLFLVAWGRRPLSIIIPN